MDAEDRLDSLASSVSDGGPVDWDGAEELASDEPARARIAALHEVARIAEFSRGLQRGLPPTTLDHAAHTKSWGGLLLLERVGEGASGEIWRAWDSRLQREVALKFLKEGSEPRLLEEARALARVRHPGVVAVHDIAEHDGRAGMAMEFLHGPTLAAALERGGALAPAEVTRIGLQLCEALDAVHAAGLVHRDLKPANVVLAGDGRAVLADFGLGRRRAAGELAGGVSGTPYFMAPELLEGAAASVASDLYALGVTLRWALTGRAPFAAQTLPELKAAAAAGASPPLAEACPAAAPALAAAIERAMEPRPEMRFASAGAMAAAIRGAAPGSPAGRGIALAATVVGLAAVALAVFSWVQPRLERRAHPVTAPVAPAAPAAAATYDVEASLLRRTGGVRARLADGDRVAPGDQLGLEFRATRRAWVYVLNDDERGETFLLFPQPLFDRANPLPADSTVTLPGGVGGRESAWTVTSRGGREHFLVVASPEPVADLESELHRLPPARPGRAIRYAPVPAVAVERLRGVGGVSALPAEVAAPGRAGAFERFEALAGRETRVKGVWVRRVTLENPLR